MDLSSMRDSTGLCSNIEMSLLRAVFIDKFQQKAPAKQPASLKFMGCLIEQLDVTIPAEFQLPQDIRTFFKDGE